MKPLDTTRILDLRCGRSIHVTRQAGHVVDGVDKAGTPRQLAYAATSPLLVDAEGKWLCGPIDYDGIKAFATEVACSNPRATTEPGAALRLATALLALMDAFERSGAVDLAMSQEAAHVG